MTNYLKKVLEAIDLALPVSSLLLPPPSPSDPISHINLQVHVTCTAIHRLYFLYLDFLVLVDWLSPLAPLPPWPLAAILHIQCHIALICHPSISTNNVIDFKQQYSSLLL